VGLESEGEVGRVRESLHEVRGETVRRHHVEADAREERHAGVRSVVVVGRQRLEHREFTGDVEVVRARRETGARQRAGGVDERPGAVQRDVDTVEV